MAAVPYWAPGLPSDPREARDCERTKEFIRHQSHRYVRLERAWRRPRGTDKRVHGRFKGPTLSPALASGFRRFLVHNVRELEVLRMCNKCHCAETAHNASSRSRTATAHRAAQPAFRVTSPDARLHSEENE
ncbi:large ribosomal subunit protein eL32-like [Glossophaga mutica]